jgi:hypothetical protein
MRQLGGAFGVAVIGAVFAATGGYGSAEAFSDGYQAALGVCAGLSFAAACVGLALHARPIALVRATPDRRTTAV